MPTNFSKIHKKEESMTKQVRIASNSKADFIKEVEVSASQEVDLDFREEALVFPVEDLDSQVEVSDFQVEDFKEDILVKVKAKVIDKEIRIVVKVINNNEELIVLVSVTKKGPINFDYQLVIFYTTN